MLSRLNLLESHVTGLPVQENLLDKYRKMSNIDGKFLDEIYYLDNKDITTLIEDVIRTEKIFT